MPTLHRHALVCLLFVLVSAGSLPSVTTAASGWNGKQGSGGFVRARASAPRPWQTVYHEHEFQGAPHLAVKPDSLLVVELEGKARGRRVAGDSGTRGVDKVPFEFEEAMEREFCWDGSALENAPPGASAHAFVLRDTRHREVVHVDEGGPCATALIEPGRYEATFLAGDGRGPESSQVFVRPAAMLVGPTDGPPPTIDPDTGPGDPDSDTACPPIPIIAVSPGDAPGISNSLEPGEVALLFESVDNPGALSYLRLDTSCPTLAQMESINLQQIKTPHGLAYRTTIFPSQGRSIALYYTRDDFLGPRIQVPDSCTCRQQNCSDCPVTNARLLDPLHYFFECARRVQDGLECTFPPEIALSASLSLLDPNAQNGNILITTNTCENCDFRHSTSLRGQNLSSVDVRGSDFSNADLGDTIFDRADARNAIFDSLITNEPFSGHPAPHVSFAGAKLTGARFAYERTVIPQTLAFIFNRAAQLAAATFSGADLTNATFPRARLEGADLSQAAVAGASFRRARLSLLLPAPPETDFCEPPDTSACDAIGQVPCAANLDGIVGDLDLREARMAGVSIRGSDLTGAHLEDVEAYAADFGPDALQASTILTGTHFNDSDLRCTNFDRAAGTQPDFTSARLTHAYLGKVALPRAILRGAQLDPANLASANLSDAVLSASPDGTVGPAKLTNAYMGPAENKTSNGGTVLDGADLSGADLSFVAWYSFGSCVDNCAGAREGAVLDGTDLTCARLQHADFSGSSMRGATLSFASLSGAKFTGGTPIDLGPDATNHTQLVRADLRAAELDKANLAGANLSSALVLSAKGPTFGVWAAKDPGHYEEAQVISPSNECSALTGDSDWLEQHVCVPVTGNATTTPLATTGGTTCPDGTQTTQSVGCGMIAAANPAWNPVPKPLPPIPDCPLE